MLHEFAAHVRIRVLLVVAVVAIGAGIFAVTEVQRRSDALSFEGYAAVRDLGDAATRMALAFGEAGTHGEEASEMVEASERDLLQAASAVQSRVNDNPSERSLVREQTRTASGLIDVARQAVARGAPERLESRRDQLLDRFVAANDKLLARLARDRRAARLDAARRPVLLVLGLFLIFGVVHLVFVELPAGRERRRGRAQSEFVDAMQVARSEAEAYDLLSRHVERVSDAHRVTVLIATTPQTAWNQ